MNKANHIVAVDFSNAKHCEDLKHLLIAYSADLMGGGKPLAPDTAERSIALMAQKDYAFSFLCYEAEVAVGFANCFESIATFAGKTAINIHDIAVLESHRRRGISSQLLEAIATHGKSNGCHKITLEVLEGNIPARKSYERAGFRPYQLDPSMGSALFFQKML